MQGLRTFIRPINIAMVDHGRRWRAVCDSDLIGMLAYHAVLGGNLAHLPYRDADGFVGIDAPDAQRHPVSILSVAASIDSPYETVRSRILRLEASGRVRRTSTGLIVPAETLGTPAMRAAQAADRSAIAAVADTLIAVDYPVPSLSISTTIDRLPAALVSRLFIDFMFRGMEKINRLHGDTISATIFVGIVSANIRHLMTEPAFAHRYHDSPPPDALRRPVTVRQLAREIGLPFETVRRRVQALTPTGQIVMCPDGLIVPAVVLAEPRFRRNGLIIARQFRRLLNEIVRLAA